MDTKWKSSPRVGALIWVMLMVLAALATWLVYPYMETTAKSWRVDYEQSMEESNRAEREVSVQVMNSVYQSWREYKQEEAGRILTPSQVFLPGLEEKIQELQDGQDDERLYEYEELQEMMDGRGQEWQHFAREYDALLKYEMVTPEGAVLRSNTENPGQYFTRNLEEGEARLTLHFDQAGKLEIRSVAGPEKTRDRLGNIMTAYEFYDPLEALTSEDYLYGDVKFAPPQNVDFVYQFQTADFGRGEAAALPMADDYANSGGYYGVVTSVAAAVMLAGLILPVFRSLEIGNRRPGRLSFEPVCFLAFCWIAVMYGWALPSAMVYLTNQGSITSELMEAGLMSGAAKLLEALVNLGVWFLVYASLFWLTVSAGAVFRLGLWRYLKERTWIGRFACWLKNWVVRCLNPFNQVDWHSNSTKAIGKAVIANFVIVSLISLFWFFGVGVFVVYSIVLFFLLQKYWKQMEEKYNLLLNSINQMAEGNLDVEITENLGLFEPLKEQLGRVRQGFKKAVEQEVKSQRMKTELITNVSHDLKTPLTAIITYVNLLKQPDLTEEDRKAYIDVLEQKSMRLKVLIEDLFEVSKAGSGNIALNQEAVDIVSLIKEVRLELSGKLGASGIEFRWHLPEEKILIWLDSQKTYRIFENLLVNITKYGMKGTRAYIEVKKEPQRQVKITLRNISSEELTISPEELTERFVRGDSARNTEGSGLGLAIARSFTEAQNGTMTVSVEGDLFRVEVQWKAMEPEMTGAEAMTETEETPEEGSSENSR